MTTRTKVTKAAAEATRRAVKRQCKSWIDAGCAGMCSECLGPDDDYVDIDEDDEEGSL